MVFTGVVPRIIGGGDIGYCLGIDTHVLLGSVHGNNLEHRSLQTFLRRASSGDTDFGAMIHKMLLIAHGILDLQGCFFDGGDFDKAQKCLAHL